MLYEEWEENDEEKLPPDELSYGHPDRLGSTRDLSLISLCRPKASKPLMLSDIDLNNPESIKRATKADKTVITLATVTGDPTKYYTVMHWYDVLNVNLERRRRLCQDSGRLVSTTTTSTSPDLLLTMTGSCSLPWTEPLPSRWRTTW